MYTCNYLIPPAGQTEYLHYNMYVLVSNVVFFLVTYCRQKKLNVRHSLLHVKQLM